MKIVQKIILANVFYIVLIALIGFFAYHNIKLVLTKLWFVEIADDLNASFLEMRLAEKNYFLYNDKSALQEIKQKLDENVQGMDFMKAEITRAIGKKNFEQLRSSLDGYMAAVEETGKGGEDVRSRLRESGQKVRELSNDITRAERKNVSEIIEDSQNKLFYSLCLILVSAIGISHFVLSKILRSFKEIEEVAHAISQGNFDKVEGNMPDDELGSVLKAINSMSEELENREEQIIQSRKLASIGILTAGVAHELGNPLNNISMIAQAYQEIGDQLSREERLDFMKKIEEETERIRDIVKNLLDFSKPTKPNREEIDVGTVVQKALKLVHNMLNVHNVDANLDLQDGLPLVYIDERQIRGVLVNLLTNAIQAMSPGNHLSIRTRTGSVPDFVEIEVQDTGKGIAREVLPYIFDPFFSTKGADGTGLGLFVSYGIIKRNRGNISAKSEVGVGTTFVIELPVC
jgi:two-component system, NtrC family, sensor kinase